MLSTGVLMSISAAFAPSSAMIQPVSKQYAEWAIYWQMLRKVSSHVLQALHPSFCQSGLSRFSRLRLFCCSCHCRQELRVLRGADLPGYGSIGTGGSTCCFPDR